MKPIKWVSGEYFLKVCIFFLVVNIGFDLLTQGYVSHITVIFIPIAIILWCLFKTIVYTYFPDVDEVYQAKKWNNKQYRRIKYSVMVSATILMGMLILGYSNNIIYNIFFAVLIISNLILIAMAYKDARHD